MTKPANTPCMAGHYHPIAIARQMRKYLLLSLTPLLRALVVWELDALSLALRQNFALLCLVFLYAALAWRATRCQYTSQDKNPTLLLQQGVFVRRQWHIQPSALAALSLECSPLLRLVRARRLVLYYATPASGAKSSISLTLPATEAVALANALLPAPCDAATLHRAGTRAQLCFALLCTSALRTGLFLLFLGQQLAALGSWAQSLALAPLQGMVQVAALFLPAAFALLIGLGTGLLCLSFIRAMLHCAGHCSWRSANDTAFAYQCGAGAWRCEHRVRRAAICYYQLRKTPLGRCLGVQLVYLGAGSFAGAAARVPFALCHTRTASSAVALPPALCIQGSTVFDPNPALSQQPLHRRSLVAFFGVDGFFFCVSALLFTATYLRNWQVLPVWLAGVCLYFLGKLWLDCVAFLQEGIYHINGNFTLVLQRHSQIDTILGVGNLPILHHRQSPFAYWNRRATLTILFIKGKKLKIRSVLLKSIP